VWDVDPVAGVFGRTTGIRGVEAATGGGELDDHGFSGGRLLGIESVVVYVEDPVLPAGTADGLDVGDSHLAEGGHAAAGSGVIPGVLIDEVTLNAHEDLRAGWLNSGGRRSQVGCGRLRCDGLWNCGWSGVVDGSDKAVRSIVCICSYGVCSEEQ
jgi:hypothetical protein